MTSGMVDPPLDMKKARFDFHQNELFSVPDGGDKRDRTADLYPIFPQYSENVDVLSEKPPSNFHSDFRKMYAIWLGCFSNHNRRHRTLCDAGGEKFEIFKLEDEYFPWTDICKIAIMEKSFRKWRLHYAGIVIPNCQLS